MINRLNELKSNSNSSTVKELCESTINTLTSAIYNGVSSEAQHEIEKISLENLFEKLSSVKDDKYLTKWISNQKRIYAVKNIGVRNAINSLRVNESKYDSALAETLNLFENKLQSVAEVLLYEEFVNSMTTFSWMPAVEKEINNIKESVAVYSNDVNITKVIEMMKLSRSNYLIPLIEDVVNNYLNDKTEQSKHILKETLVKFSYDDYVRNIINLVMDDSVALQLEYASANADIENIYSPLIYLGENEVLFNVKGTYYVKKGNNVNRIKNAEVSKIDSKFRSICEAINHSFVEISKKDIKIFYGKDSAVINENSITINDKLMSLNEFKEAEDISHLAGNIEFFKLANLLKDNFDEIVEVDFAKRVYLKENVEHAADIFKLRENICITTYDPLNNKVTFYRNINPIQAEKIMMEHMRFDVSKAFKDILPNKDKILTQISETKQSYIDYINELNSKLNELNRQQKSTVIDLAIAAVNEELSEIKNEYKDYNNQIEKYTNVSEGITLHLDVDGTKYTIPIPQADSLARGEDKGEESNDSQESGTEIKSDTDVEPSSQITFDNDESELLGDNPSMETDRVDLGVDDVEAAADAAEAALNNDDDQEGENPEGENPEGENPEGENPEGEDDVELDDLGLDDETPEEGEEKPVKKKEEGEEEDEDAEHLNDSLEKTPLKTKPAIVEDGEAKPVDKSKKKLFLKKSKVQESFHINLKKKINEAINVGDSVMYKNQKGYITGEMDGKFIVQVQGSSHRAAPTELTLTNKKPDAMDVPFKFDKKTLKALREQYVKCGIYMNSVPVKLNECFVNYSDWDNSRDDQFVNVIIEGRTSVMSKTNVRILEDINDFANPDNYIPGVIIDEATQEVTENVLINAIDYTQAIGDTASVRIIRREGDDQVSDTLPLAQLKTLSV